MGEVIAFHSTRLKSRRNSWLLMVRGKSPVDSAQTYTAGIDPRCIQELNALCVTPKRLASLRRWETEPRTSATVIPMAFYTSHNAKMSSRVEFHKGYQQQSPELCKKLICRLHKFPYKTPMANRTASKKGRRYAQIGERLEKIQTLMGYGEEGGGVQMARALGLTEGQWSVFRSGTREIKPMYAARLVRLCSEYLEGASMDYIYLGGPSPRPLRRALPEYRKGA